MPSTRASHPTCGVFIALVLGLSCAPASAPPARALRPTSPQPAAARAPRPPPPVVKGPMPGEPQAAALAEARLVASSCEEDAQRIEATVERMKREVAARLEQWKKAQPGCWTEYWRRAQEERARFGGGGLGLTGIGEGGGGYGSGIGLGSIGTIGHGSGTAQRVAGALGSTTPRAARSASGTNNQVADVDEADIVKTDGRYVYVAANGALRIIEALRPRIVSVTKLGGALRDLFIEGDRAVVYTSSAPRGKPCTYGYDCVFAGDGTTTRISVLDISSREHPKIVRHVDLSGSLMTSRRIGNVVHTVVADHDSQTPLYETWPVALDMCGTKESVVRAAVAKLKVENERAIRSSVRMPTIRDTAGEAPLCTNLLRTPFEDGQAFTTVVSFDLRDDHTPATTATIQSRPGAVFASADALYVAVGHRRSDRSARWYSFYSAVDEASDVHKFRLGATPRETRYVGSGVVPGHVLNQFAMDEWSGYLRIATTRGRVPESDVSSAVSILAEGEGGNLVRVGAVEQIAPGEDIRAVRFDGDRGYVVTFKKTDPLFVVDLYDAAHPALLGELKIPGFSTYMHRIDADHLLSIGFDANDHGDFAYYDGVILQLFDVADPTEPKLLHREKIGTRGSSSEAATDHLAFNYFGDRGLLAVPMTICQGGGDGQNGALAFSGLLVYQVDVARGFERLGGIDHGTRGADCNAWWSHATSAVKRSVFLDDLVYSIAPDRIKVQRLGHFGENVADLALLP